MEILIRVFAEHSLVIVAVILAVIVFAFAQAGVRTMSDYFMVRFFKRKPNGNGNANGGMTHEQGEELIKAMKANGETQAAIKIALGSMGGQVGDMHEATMTKDDDGVSRIGNAFKRVHELYKKAVRGGGGG